MITKVMKQAIHQKEDPQISSATSTVPRCGFKIIQKYSKWAIFLTLFKKNQAGKLFIKKKTCTDSVLKKNTSTKLLAPF